MQQSSLFDHLTHLPLFPLPDALLFPTMRLPLHIFEPRYRQLVRDAKRDQLPIAIGHIDNSFERPSGQVPVHPVVGAGWIDELEELPDGRFLMVLVGERRVRIVGEQESPLPYRVAIAEPVVDQKTTPEENQRALGELRRVILALHRVDPKVAHALSEATIERNDAGQAADVIASSLQTDPRVLQGWLDELDPVRRLMGVIEALEIYMARKSPHGGLAN